ncbi:MAG: hypothetical protein JO092_06125 [Candidatus Eremiobacteraeota bacterium]|nr:hypothetical protein [Candidatus Eremiobacteraeota bacterium]
MQRVRLVLSFDHELSLGGTDSYPHNLFNPTDDLMALSDELGVPIVLFTDVLCALRYKTWDPDGFFEPYRKQLGLALRRGHDVQLHIHPHWIDSSWVDGVYRPSAHFALGDFEHNAPPNDVRGIVKRAYDFLSELCLAFDPNYRCIAYRAGGHNLAPATAAILTSLYDCGIRIDSSIIKGFRFASSLSTVDFSIMPKCANWTIPTAGPLDAESETGLFEIPVASMPRTPLNNLPFLFRRLVHRGRSRDPRGRTIHSAHTPLLQKAARLFPYSAWPLAFDDAAYTINDVMNVFLAHLAAHRSEAEIICASVSHPKSMGEYELALMRAFVSRVREQFRDAVEFTTYRAVYRDRVPAEPCATIQRL